ncbi:MAG: DUF1080 domain-containing protein [Acidobacteriota bacterium]
MRLFPIFILAAAVWAGDARFNGRWDLTAADGRASWLEITGAETGKPSGKFVSAFDGDMNVIEKISITDGAIEFGWPGRNILYAAKLVNGKLEGTAPGKWVGVRAPVIKEHDDGTWREAKPVTLFNGKDLSGWKAKSGPAPIGWSVKDGALAGNGKANDIVSEQKFWNFKLHCEFKIAEHSNSGVGLRGRYEIQVLDDYGKQQGTHNNGALYARIAPAFNASKPAGEWQTYDIRLVGRDLTVVLNGKTIIDKREIEGLTAIAVDSNEAEPGPIYLQGDHGPVEYRNIVVTPLVK